MTRRITMSACGLLLAVSGLAIPADAQAADAINVTALPAPCPSAIPNDGGDDAPAIQCAINLMPGGSPDGGEIYIPAGTYYLDSTLTMTDRRAAIRGDGQGITRLIWRATTAPEHDGIRYVSNALDVNYTLAVRSISLLRGSSNGGAALSARWQKPSWHGEFGIVTATIHDVHIGADPWSSGAYWHIGIKLINPTTTKISTFNIQGAASNAGIAGIQIDGSESIDPGGSCDYAVPSSWGNCGKAIGTQIRNGSITRYVRGIESKSNAEGLHVQNVSILEVLWGIQTVVTGQGTAFANNTIQARIRGIQVLEGSGNLAITNNQIHRFGADDFAGISFENFSRYADNSRVIGNSIYSPTTTQTRYGILLTGQVYDTIIEGNTIQNMGIGIFLSGANVQRNFVFGNLTRGAGTGWFESGTPPGSNSFIHNPNIP